MIDDNYSLKDDFFTELANVGMGNAATSLSQMINAKVTLSLPSINITPIDQLMKNESTAFCAVTMGITGDASGVLVTVFPDKTSFWLIDKISGKSEGDTKEYDDMGQDAMKEFVNIIGGSFLTSLSLLLNYKLLPKPPQILLGLGKDIKSKVSDSIKPSTKDMLYVSTEISVNEKKVEGEIYLILNKGSFEKMFDKMQNLLD